MMPRVYFDIEALAATEDTGMSAPALRGRMLALLHPLFAAQPHTYALAIPAGRQAVCDRGGGALRVFASSRDDLDALVDSLSRLPWIRDYARLHYPASVPENYAGAWVAFRRYRVPSLNSDRRTGEEAGQLRQRRMQTVQKEKMDYFIVSSKTTEQRFTLAVRRESGAPPQAECLPNSYGLCSAHNVFCVPDLP